MTEAREGADTREQTQTQDLEPTTTRDLTEAEAEAAKGGIDRLIDRLDRPIDRLQ